MNPTIKIGMALVAVFVAWRVIDYAAATDVVPSIVDARVLRVVDGDTIEVNAVLWIDQTVNVMVRLRGIDAPETRGQCPTERWKALEATEWLKAAITGKDVTLTDIGVDKFGRTLATIWSDQTNIAEQMLSRNLVRPYDGGPRKGWCE